MTDDTDKPAAPMALLSGYLTALGKRGGTKRMAALTPKERKALGKKAAHSRWAGHVKKAKKSDSK